MPRVFTEPRPYPLFRFPNRANPSLFIIFSLAKLSATVPFVTIRPLLPSIADCASVHEVRVAGLALPPNSRRKGSSHRRATVQPSLRPPSRHRRSSVAPSYAPPSRRLCCALFRAYVAPSFARTSRPPSRTPSCLRRPTSPRSPTATTWRQTLHCCSV